MRPRLLRCALLLPGAAPMRAWPLCLALSGCALIDGSATSPGDGGAGSDSADVPKCRTPPCRQLINELPGAPPSRDLDLLFVIDNSNSMMEEQAALASALPRFVDALSGAAGGLPNLHVGVISADVGIGFEAESCDIPTGDH